MARLANRLTDTECRKAKTEAKLYLRDGNGLYLRVLPESKYWFFRYILKGEEHWQGLGAYPEVSLADAREAADASRKLIKQGLDPLLQAKAEKDTKRKQQIAAAETVDRESAIFKAVALEYFIEKKHEDIKREEDRDLWKKQLAKYIYRPLVKVGDTEQPFGDVRVSDITVNMVAECLRPIWKPSDSERQGKKKRAGVKTAKILQARIAEIIGFAMVKGYRPKGPNPAAWKDNLEHLLASPTKVARQGSPGGEDKHHAALPCHLMNPFLIALRLEATKLRTCMSATALEFLIWTAARTEEVLLATWGEIDLEQGLWTVPARRMKGARKHIVPLTGPACAILRRLKGDEPKPPDWLVFPGRTGRPLAGDGMLRVLMRINEHTLKYEPRPTVHGLRSTFRDWCGDETEFDRETAELSLAHKTGNEAELAYRRGAAIKKRRALLEAWAQFCEPEPRLCLVEAA
jgi:integrase